MNLELFLLALVLLAVVQCFILGLYLVSKWVELSYRLLGLVFLSGAGLFLMVFLRNHFQVLTDGPWSLVLALGIGPLLFLHARALMYADFVIPNKWSLSYLVLVLLIAIGGSFTKTKALSSFIVVSIQLVFIALALWEHKKYLKSLRTSQSNLQISSLNWMRNSFIGIFIILALAGSQEWAATQDMPQLAWWLTIATVASFDLLISVYFLKALSHPNIFSGVNKSDKPKETLSQQELSSIQDSLVQALNQEACFKNSNLQIKDVSELIGVQESSITEAIKRGLASNFYDFINAKRIEYAKELLGDSSVGITELMHEAGFNSKSSFNQEFKKRAGCTPSQWRKNKNEHFL